MNCFVEYFLKNFKYIGPLGDEDVGKNISKEFGDSEYLLKSFLEADSVGESSVYSYFTKKGLVITVPVNHAIDGYAEFIAECMIWPEKRKYNHQENGEKRNI